MSNRIHQAQRLAQQGQLAQAVAEFRAILMAHPRNIEAKFGLATVLAMSGQPGSAISLFREVVQAKPNHLAALLNLGNALLQQNDPAEAEQAFVALLKLEPDSVPAMYGLGCALQQQGHASKAENYYRKTLPVLSSSPELWMNLATTLRQQSRLDEAADAYRKAIQLKPDLFQAWSALGQTLLESGNLHDSESAFNQALQLAPQRIDACIGLGDVLAAQKRETDALKCYQTAIELDPRSQNAHTKLESLLLKLAGSAGDEPLFTRFSTDRVYSHPADSIPDALALLDAYRYPESDVLDKARSFFECFKPEQLYTDAWWKQQLSVFDSSTKGHEKVLRGICSALYSWSAPTQEAIESVARFVGTDTLHSFGAGTGYWEWLLAQHFGVHIRVSDQILRHRYVEMVVEDYGTTTVAEGDVVMLAWIPRGVTAVMNLMQQMRSGQKLILIGEGPDVSGRARICATEAFYNYISTNFKLVSRIELSSYSYIKDDVRLYQRH